MFKRTKELIELHNKIKYYKELHYLFSNGSSYPWMFYIPLHNSLVNEWNNTKPFFLPKKKLLGTLSKDEL